MEFYPSHNSETYLRGEVFMADLDQGTTNIDSEQQGSRPVIIIQNDVGNRYSPTVIVAAITSQPKKPLPTHVIIYAPSILRYKSTICLEQIRTIDKSRLTQYLGKVDNDIINKLDHALLTSVGVSKIEPEPIEYHIPDVRTQTLFDDNNTELSDIIEQQMIFFENIEQHITNRRIDLNDINQRIEDILDYIGNTNYNAAQGYKVYKMLRELRRERSKAIDDIKRFEAFTSVFDCESMQNSYRSCLEAIQQVAPEAPVKAVVGLD